MDMTNEMFQMGTVHLDESEVITLRLESGNNLRFQPDTGAQCDVIPASLYKKATRDLKLENVNPIHTPLVAYGGTQLSVVEQVILKVYRNDTSYYLDCKLVNEETGRPLLGRKACVGMKIVQYLNNNAISKPTVEFNVQVFATDISKSPDLLKREALLKKYPAVFGDKTGEMAAKYQVRVDESATPVQDPPRRVPVALREKVKQKLEELSQQEIIEPVTTPTRWISSMVKVVKNGKLRICQDP